jgi:hypothetical protein
LLFTGSLIMSRSSEFGLGSYHRRDQLAGLAIVRAMVFSVRRCTSWVDPHRITYTLVIRAW